MWLKLFLNKIILKQDENFYFKVLLEFEPSEISSFETGCSWSFTILKCKFLFPNGYTIRMEVLAVFNGGKSSRQILLLENSGKQKNAGVFRRVKLTELTYRILYLKNIATTYCNKVWPSVFVYYTFHLFNRMVQRLHKSKNKIQNYLSTNFVAFEIYETITVIGAEWKKCCISKRKKIKNKKTNL